MQEITANDVHRLIEENPQVILVDALGPQSFAEKHLPHSVSIPEHDPRFLEKAHQKIPDKSTPVVTYCADVDCPASEKAAHRLEEDGYRDVREFRGGLEGWEKAGYEFEHGRPGAM